PIEAQAPVAVLNAPPLLGDCQNLILESASYGYGPLKYKWELMNNDLEYSHEIGNILNNLSDTTTSVTIPANYIEPGTLLFRLNVTDLYLQTSSTTITVEKSEYDQIPMAMIECPFHRIVKRRDGFFIDAQAKFSPCVPTSGKRLQFSWSSEPPLNFASSKNPRLFVPPYLLESGIQYKFILDVSVININTEEELAKTTIEAFVTAESSNLIAKISGGSSRTVPAISTLVIDASSSHDPDDPQTNL